MTRWNPLRRFSGAPERLPRLRLLLALSFGAIGLVGTIVLASLVAHEARERLEGEVGGQLAELAEHMAGNLDLGMFERWRDIQIAASLETLRDPGADLASKYAVLESIHRTYPAYSLVALIDPDGRILTTSSGILTGADVADRDYFREGRQHPFVGDVHPAKLLARHVPSGEREPLRLIDVAAPVHAQTGALTGVLAAHLNWTWARDTARTLALSLRGHRQGSEILILARDGKVLLGPSELEGQILPTHLRAGSPGETQSSTGQLVRWPDTGEMYVTAAMATNGYRDYPGLGWQVVVRQQADRALATSAALQRSILIAGSLVAVVAAFLVWLVAGRIARPLQALSHAATALGRNEALPRLPRPMVREDQAIADALSAASRALAEREASHRLLVDELNHRVKNTLATIQSLAAQSLRDSVDIRTGRRAFESRLLALSAAHNVLTQGSWSAVDLRQVIATIIRGFEGDAVSRFGLSGPAFLMAPEPALALSMIVHELCTNAAKYGALSVPAGTVTMVWRLDGVTDRRARLTFVWQEHGGPPVRAPERSGFGSRLIGRGLNGPGADPVTIDYAPSGLIYAFEAILAACLDPAAPESGDPVSVDELSPDAERECIA